MHRHHEVEPETLSPCQDESFLFGLSTPETAAGKNSHSDLEEGQDVPHAGAGEGSGSRGDLVEGEEERQESLRKVREELKGRRPTGKYLRVATWNVTGTAEMGKRESVEQEAALLSIAILAIQETKMNASSKEKRREPEGGGRGGGVASTPCISPVE